MQVELSDRYNVMPAFHAGVECCIIFVIPKHTCVCVKQFSVDIYSPSSSQTVILIDASLCIFLYIEYKYTHTHTHMGVCNYISWEGL